MKTKKRILVVDDSPINRSLLADILSSDYSITELENGVEAVDYLKEHLDEVMLVLLDIIMPVMDGFEFLDVMKNKGWLQDIPVITISSDTAPQSIEKAYRLGVYDYINRPFNDLIVQKRVSNTILLNAKQKQLENMLVDKILENERNNLLTIEILQNLLKYNDAETDFHVSKMRILVNLLMRELSILSEKYDFSQDYISHVMSSIALYDIGEIKLPNDILNKTERLTPEEYKTIQDHPIIGAELLKKASFFEQEKFAQTAYEVCRWHHERYDGNGYPDGLIGEQIPLSAQIVGLADVYVAITSPRIHRPPYEHNQAVQMILNGECGVFNPDLLDCFYHIQDRLKERMQAFTLKNVLINLEDEAMDYHLIKQKNVSHRTLSLLEQERTKYKFFASMSGEVQFEYSAHSNILTISEWGTTYLHLPEIIMNPMNNDILLQHIPISSLQELHTKVKSASKEQPTVELLTEIKVDNTWHWFKIFARPLWEEETSEMIGIIGKCVDVHEEHTKMNHLKMIADQDSLTELWNHKAAREQIEYLLKENTDQNYAMILMDLDFFKNANDKYGHMFGDEVLRYVGERLLECAQGESIISRVGGDEFSVFLKYKDSIEEKVQQIYEYMTCEYKDFNISISMGISLFPQDGLQYETIYKQADLALYAAKNLGKNRYCFYNAKEME